MIRSILARMGLVTQKDKKELENHLAELSKQIMQLESQMKNDREAIDRSLDDVIEKTVNSIRQVVSESQKSVIETIQQSGNDYNREIEKYMASMNADLEDHKNALLEEIQKECALLRCMDERMDNNILDILGEIKGLRKDGRNNTMLLQDLEKGKITKDDFDVISSFLRLIAANQLIQETYLAGSSLDEK